MNNEILVVFQCEKWFVYQTTWFKLVTRVRTCDYTVCIFQAINSWISSHNCSLMEIAILIIFPPSLKDAWWSLATLWLKNAPHYKDAKVIVV